MPAGHDGAVRRPSLGLGGGLPTASGLQHGGAPVGVGAGDLGEAALLGLEHFALLVAAQGVDRGVEVQITGKKRVHRRRVL